MTEQTPHTDTPHSDVPPQDTQPNTQHPHAAGAEHEAASHDANGHTFEGSVEEHIASLEAKLADMEDRWKRSEAENQNLRARHKREVEDARQYSVQKFARDVVEAAENLHRGLAALPPKQDGEDGLITRIREGFEGTERAFLSMLERHGITKQDPTHKPFDANLHQAMQEQDTSDLPAGYVIQAWTPTWLIKSRLLKPAMVIVSSSASTGQPPKETPKEG